MSGAERSGAAEAAEAEAGLWSVVADWIPQVWTDVAPEEAAVVRFFDPTDDLAGRARSWGHRLPDASLSSMAAFGAGLAAAETEAWERDEPHIATRAYTDRRFLLGDRLLHWAVPWLDAVGRCYPQHREAAHDRRDILLRVGDRLRTAPDLVGGEGLTPPGEDAFGPIELDVPLAEWLRSLWSGAVILDATMRSLGLAPSDAAPSDAAPSDEPSGLASSPEGGAIQPRPAGPTQRGAIQPRPAGPTQGGAIQPRPTGPPRGGTIQPGLECLPSGGGGPSRRLGTEGVLELDRQTQGGAARKDLVSLYEIAAHRWAALATAHPGSSRLWRDLAARAARTALTLTA